MTSASGTRQNGASAFAVPAFRRLWAAGAISDAGDWLLFIALPLLVLRLTGSAFGTAFAFLLEIAPAIVLGSVAGRLADRLPARPLLVVVTLAQAAAVSPLLLVRTADQLPVVYCVIVALSALAAVFEPAKNALLPTLVGRDRIVSANALVGLNNDVGRLVGGPVGGLLLAAAGLPLVVVVDLVTYLVAAGLIASLPSGAWQGGQRERPGSATEPGGSSGLLAALRRPGVRVPFAVLLAASVAQGLFVVLFVFFVTETLRGGDGDVGLLRGLQAVGAIVAGVVLGSGRVKIDVSVLTVIGAAGFAVLTLGIWNLSFLTTATPVYALLFAAIGAPGVLMASGLLSRLQSVATDADRGSVFAAAGAVQAVGQGAGLLLAGSLQGVLGTLPMLEVQGGLYVVAALLALRLRRGSARLAPLVEEGGQPVLEEAEELGHLGEAGGTGRGRAGR